MARVREAEYHELAARQRGGLLRGLMFIHLKKDLDVQPVDWLHCEDPYDESVDPRPPERRRDLTRYGIRKDVQALLAGIRTDLDSFADTEAYALMTSGYRMTEDEFRRSIQGFAPGRAPAPNWKFLEIEPPMQDAAHPDHSRLLQLLHVAGRSAFRIWSLSGGLRITAIGVGLLAALGLGWACWHWRALSLLTVGSLGLAVLTTLAGLVVGKLLVKVVRYRETILRIAVGIVMAAIGWLIAGIHLRIFDRWYLRRGRWKTRDARGHRPGP